MKDICKSQLIVFGSKREKNHSKTGKSDVHTCKYANIKWENNGSSLVTVGIIPTWLHTTSPSTSSLGTI